MYCDESPDIFLKERHIKFFMRCLNILPPRYGSYDSSRMSLAFFAISGLDMMNAVTSNFSDCERFNIIDWIYSLQILPNERQTNEYQCGFRGCHCLGNAYDTSIAAKEINCIPSYDTSHVAMTYTALLTLLILGDDFTKLNRPAILRSLKVLQKDDGSFCATMDGSENDMRFVYCVCCICYILNDWSTIDLDHTVDYILKSLTYEGAFGQGPFYEAHGGSTFCATASLHLMGRLDSAMSQKQLTNLKRWCLERQKSKGFQGRPNKPVDTCYSFWVGATLTILNFYHFVDKATNLSYVLSTQDKLVGGFSKWPGHTPDPLHTYFGICGLSLMDDPSVQKMNPALNVSHRAALRLSEIHARWLKFEVDTSAVRNAVNIHNNLQNLVNDEENEIYYDALCEFYLDKKPKHQNSLKQFIPEDHVLWFLNYIRKMLPAIDLKQTDSLSSLFSALSALDLLKAQMLLDEKPFISELIKTHLSCHVFNNGFYKYTNDNLEHANGITTINYEHLSAAYYGLLCLMILEPDKKSIEQFDVMPFVSFLSKFTDESLSSDSSVVTLEIIFYIVNIVHLIHSCDKVKKPNLIEFIMSYQSSEGCFADGSYTSKVASTYFAVASLYHLDALNSDVDLYKTIEWCEEKLSHSDHVSNDSLDSANVSDKFRLIASLTILTKLNPSHLIELSRFILESQSKKRGGFFSDSNVSINFYCICTLSIAKETHLKEVEPLLFVSKDLFPDGYRNLCLCNSS